MDSSELTLERGSGMDRSELTLGQGQWDGQL